MNTANKKQTTIHEFLNAFKVQIKESEDQYYQQKQQMKEQIQAANR